eukprot:1873895-Pyramimonas_sp.AAC.2
MGKRAGRAWAYLSTCMAQATLGDSHLTQARASQLAACQALWTCGGASFLPRGDLKVVARPSLTDPRGVGKQRRRPRDAGLPWTERAAAAGSRERGRGLEGGQ